MTEDDVNENHSAEAAWRWAASEDPHQRMADMIYGYMVSQTVRAFAEFSVADHLAEGALTSAQIAAREGSAPETTGRLLRAGIVYGLVEVDDEGRFHRTELLDTLRSDASRSLRGMALGATNTSHWAPWAALPYGARVGTSQVRQTLGMPAFDYLVHNPEQAREFTAYMESVTSLWAFDVVQAIDTRGVGLAVDIGGANGALLRELLSANPELHGVVFDRPDVADAVGPVLAESEFASRASAFGGDFFEAVPSGDLYLLKFILHDWDDDDCVRILTSCREAMRPGARVAIIEMVVGEGNNPGVAAVMDLNMLAVTDGRERTLAQYDRLLAEAGFRRCSFWSNGSPQGVIEAVATTH
ncbi:MULTISPECIES: methyltransferase [unclassified Mycobacterium]|uniref:methyltransferase n=1 Tax=unclassified Mycobacterium TaxID=2642494 RepID=UPI0029C8F75D|nr:MULTISPECIES: methyltransferase [unclassified Mycobacterium]